MNVSSETLDGLRIEPSQAVVDAGEQAIFRIYAQRGKRARALSPEDGGALKLSNPQVAKLGGDFSVTGTHPGTTEVSYELGSQKAIAKLTVNVGATKEPPPRKS